MRYQFALLQIQRFAIYLFSFEPGVFLELLWFQLQNILKGVAKIYRHTTLENHYFSVKKVFVSPIFLRKQSSASPQSDFAN